MLKLDEGAQWLVRGQDPQALEAFKSGVWSQFHPRRDPRNESFWTDKFPRPEVAIVLGSGLGAVVKKFDKGAKVVSFTSLWPWATSQLQGHDKQVVVGKIKGVPVIAFAGRLHLYEGYMPQQVVQPVLLAKALGVGKIILTNAAGCIRVDWQKGDLMALVDHLNETGMTPLLGENNPELGPRFPSMSKPYVLQDLIMQAAQACGITNLREGVYAQMLGPEYESPATIRKLRNLGADAVGMSTALEAIVANYCGMQVGAISLLTNMAAGITGEHLSHEEVTEAGKQAEVKFTKLVLKLIRLCAAEQTTP